MRINIKKLKSKRSIFVFVLLCMFGYLFGHLTITHFQKTFMLNQSAFYSLLSAPTQEFVAIYLSLSSQDEGLRTAAYYGAGERSLIDAEFLLKRFELEKNNSARRAILFVLKNSSKKDYDSLIALHPEFSEKKGKVLVHPPYRF